MSGVTGQPIELTCVECGSAFTVARRRGNYPWRCGADECETRVARRRQASRARDARARKQARINLRENRERVDGYFKDADRALLLPTLLDVTDRIVELGPINRQDLVKAITHLSHAEGANATIDALNHLAAIALKWAARIPPRTRQEPHAEQDEDG
jgi:hypothetical protein